MKRAILHVILALFLTAGAYMAYLTAQAIRYYNIEGSIHAAYFPLIMALDQYGDAHGRAPERLQDLVPDYLDKIPAMKRVSDVRYTFEKGKPYWRLTLESRATGENRLYIAERGIPLSEQEKKDLVLRYHTRWNVVEP